MADEDRRTYVGLSTRNDVGTSATSPIPVSTLEKSNDIPASFPPETLHASPPPSTDKPAQGSLLWVLGRLQQGADETKTLHVLAHWAHRQCHTEITPSLLALLRTTLVEDSTAILRDLKCPPRWIRRVGQTQSSCRSHCKLLMTAGYFQQRLSSTVEPQDVISIWDMPGLKPST